MASKINKPVEVVNSPSPSVRRCKLIKDIYLNGTVYPRGYTLSLEDLPAGFVEGEHYVFTAPLNEATLREVRHDKK
jgi:hypothetical protein